MKKLNLILLSLVAAIPAGFLVYSLVMAMTLKHVWEKKPLIGIILSAGVAALIVAIWPPLYAIAWYSGGPTKADEEAGDGEADEAEAVEEADAEEAEEADGFAQEEIPEDLDELKGKSSGDDDDFDMSDDDISAAETGDFDLGDSEFEDLGDFEEEEELEEAPKKKKKKK